MSGNRDDLDEIIDFLIVDEECTRMEEMRKRKRGQKSGKPSGGSGCMTMIMGVILVFLVLCSLI